MRIRLNLIMPLHHPFVIGFQIDKLKKGFQQIVIFKIKHNVYKKMYF